MIERKFEVVMCFPSNDTIDDVYVATGLESALAEKFTTRNVSFEVNKVNDDRNDTGYHVK